MRPTQEETLMRMAETVALRSTCDRLNVGCIIARDARVISTGYNGNVSGQEHCKHNVANKVGIKPCTTAVHAEANALVFAARHGVAVHENDLWTTHQPCLDCAKLIINAGIWRVYYKNPYRLTEGLDLLLDVGLSVYLVREDYSTFKVTQ